MVDCSGVFNCDNCNVLAKSQTSERNLGNLKHASSTVVTALRVVSAEGKRRGVDMARALTFSEDTAANLHCTY
jgi:hypothetical protein